MLKPFGQPGQTTSNAMGNLCAPELELDCQLACAGHVHTCKYPMYLVKAGLWDMKASRGGEVSGRQIAATHCPRSRWRKNSKVH